MSSTPSRQIQIRRGTAAEHAEFTGAPGEITVDTTTNTIRVHDGATAGGFALAHQSELDAADYVIETYRAGEKWYRKYKSGWVEQGGVTSVGALESNVAQVKKVTLPVEMANITYNATAVAHNNSTFSRLVANLGPRATTNIQFGIRNIGTDVSDSYICWSVSGMAA